MLYPIVRPLAAIAFRIYFRKIYMNGLDGVPKGKPVMLVANHPTTFVEPCILACFTGRPLYYLVRGDFFQHPIFGALLRDLHMIPIFRMKDGGYGSLKNNYDTFSACHEWLADNKTVMVLAEGSAIYEKRLRPLRKGAARIAMGTLEKYPDLELYVVPVGVNFTDSNLFGSQAMINFAEPFLAKEYHDIFRTNEAKANKAFTDQLRSSLKSNIVIIEKESDDWLVNTLLDMQRNDYPVKAIPTVTENMEPFKREKQLADDINELDPNKKKTLNEQCKSYTQQLEKLQIRDDILAMPEKYQSKTFLGVLLGLIPAAIGYLLNILPYQLMRYITNNIVIFNEFFGSVRIASSIGTFLVYYLILLIGLSVGFGLKGLIYFIMIPILGYFALHYWWYFQDWKTKQQLSKVEPERVAELTKLRSQILNSARG